MTGSAKNYSKSVTHIKQTAQNKALPTINVNASTVSAAHCT